MFFKKKIPQRSFTDVLTALGAQKFDVAPAGEGAARQGDTGRQGESARGLEGARGSAVIAAGPAAGIGRAGMREPSAYRVSKYGCAAEIAPVPAEKGSKVVPTEIVSRPGWVLNGQIARILDRGYQKFLQTPKLTIVATADHLRAIHQFTEELDHATGGTMLYNESLGAVSNRYEYDRVKGRHDRLAGEQGEPMKPTGNR